PRTRKSAVALPKSPPTVGKFALPASKSALAVRKSAPAIQKSALEISVPVFRGSPTRSGDIGPRVSRHRSPGLGISVPGSGDTPLRSRARGPGSGDTGPLLLGFGSPGEGSVASWGSIVGDRRGARLDQI